MTPTLARMIGARQEAMNFPIKWFTAAQCFRYERTTRGRKREHYQWNLDIIGEESTSAEAEVIATAVNALNILGLNSDSVKVYFSSRALLSELLSVKGISEEHHDATFLALDKRGKLDDDAIRELLTESGLNSDVIENVFSLLKISSLSEALGLLPPESNAKRDIDCFTSHLTSYGISDIVEFDISIVRGLSYYTGIVFEGKDVEGKFRAIFGGGRYANLLEDIGGKPASGVGLGFGDVVIAEILTEISPATTAAVSATTIGFMTGEQQPTAIKTATALRKKGDTVDLSLKPEKPKAFFSRAGKKGFTSAIYIGPDDIESGTIKIKNLETREVVEVPLDQL